MARLIASRWACPAPMAASACATAICWNSTRACRCTARFASTRHRVRTGRLSNLLKDLLMNPALQGSLMADVAGTWLTAEDRHLLRQPEVGGLILFGRNIEHPRQVRELCAAVRAERPDLLIAVDQEGGR